MKKLAILFLLTTVLAAFSFAQVSITGDFSLENVTSGNGLGLTPVTALKFAGSGSKDLGPGAIVLSGELQYKIYFAGNKAGTAGAGVAGSAYDLGDNNFRVGYALEAGPGTLSFGIKWADVFRNREIDIGYDAITLGPATLGFGAWYALKTNGVVGGVPVNMGDDPVESDELGFRLGVGFDFGLNITYKFIYATQQKDIANLVYLDINFTGIENLTIGLELDETGLKKTGYNGGFFEGFLVKPYLAYAIQEDISVGAYAKFDNINSDLDMVLTPGVWVSYSF